MAEEAKAVTPYHESDGVTLYHGDCLQVLRTLPAESIDAVVSDPPYGLSFMGKRWDYDVPATEVWAECLRVLKPGGHLLAFAGTRTQHRMAVRIEDAGFEVRDMIAWVYGSGFPKSLNVAKAIESGGGRPEDIRRMQMGKNYQSSGRGRSNYDHGAGSAIGDDSAEWEPVTDIAKQWSGWGTALKPALEPITVARKPLSGTVAETVLQYGTGALNVDGCRVGMMTPEEVARSGTSTKSDGWGMKPKSWASEGREPQGRWPANLIHDGSDEVTGLFPETTGVVGAKREGGDKSIFSGGGHKQQNTQRIVGGVKDAGSAARFFYCAKASKKDRGEGNNHPTVKPTALMRYLCKLITPPGGLVLDPFTGSGSTGRGAVLEGFRFVGMELDAEHIKEAKRRILEVQNGWTDEPEDEPVEDLPGQRLLF